MRAIVRWVCTSVDAKVGGIGWVRSEAFCHVRQLQRTPSAAHIVGSTTADIEPHHLGSQRPKAKGMLGSYARREQEQGRGITIGS